MTGGLRFILLGLAAAVVLALSPGALGDGGQPIVVALSNGPSYVVNYQTLDGVITHSVPAPTNFGGVGFVPAANGSIVYSDGTGVWLMHPDGSTLELDSSSYDLDPSISYDGSKVVFAIPGQGCLPRR